MKVKMSLSPTSVNKAIEQIKEYQKELNEKTEEFIVKLAEIGIPVIDQQMSLASFTVDSKGIMSGSDTSYVIDHIKIERHGLVNRAILAVKGEDLMFIEFGAGVKYNGPAGQSPHPIGKEIGYTIGSFGNGHGKQNTWGYIEDGKLILTHGTKATMPVYSASLKIANEVETVARRVFKAL